jgi:signal transduction histidine kinase
MPNKTRDRGVLSVFPVLPGLQTVAGLSNLRRVPGSDSESQSELTAPNARAKSFLSVKTDSRNASLPESAEDLGELVQAGIGSPEGSVNRILECVANRLQAYGCALWESATGADWNARPAKGQLFTLASWFPADEIFAVDALDLGNSATGEAILANEPRQFARIREQGGAGKDNPFLRRHRIGPMCAVPLVFLDGGRGALNVYRQEEAPLLSPEEMLRQQRMAAVIPALLRAVREKVGLKLITEIDAILREQAREEKEQPITKEHMGSLLHRVCERIGDAFNCLEVSVFLEDILERKGLYRLRATTAPWPLPREEYTTSDGDRLTGWVLRTGKDLNLRDLVHLQHDRENILRDYPRLPIDETRNDPELARKALNLPSIDELPPLSYAATPVYSTDQLIGVLRCHLARSGPFYFSASDVSLLGVAAAQVGHFWTTWLRNREIRQETESWGRLITNLGELNDFVRLELVNSQDKPDERELSAKVLQSTSSIIPGAVINSVRLLDTDTRELYFAAVSKNAWQGLNAWELQSLLGKRFSLDTEPDLPGADVLRTGDPFVAQDVSGNPGFQSVFPNVVGIVIVPIKIANTTYGVLDLRWITKAPMPRRAVEAALLIGRQLGLYLDLIRSVAALRAAGQHSVQSQEEQRRTFEDLAHQLKSPLSQALLRAGRALNQAGSDSDRARLAAVRGLCRKAGRVAMSMRLLAELAKGGAIKLKLAPLDPDVVVKTLIEMAQDAELTVDPERGIRVLVEREDFNSPSLKRFQWDFDLAEQAINNLLDNAAKYSYANTTIRVHGGVSQTGRFYVAVTNRGLLIREDEVRKCFLRGWRGADAKMVTGEGSGIGLWIVDQIMRAHGGQTEIVRRTPDGNTEVRIYLPAPT